MLSKNIRFESIVGCIKIAFCQKNGKLMCNDRVIARNSLYELAQTAYRQSALIRSGYMEVSYNNINFTDNIDLLFKFYIDCKLDVIFNNCKFKNLQLIHKQFNVSLCFYNCEFQEKAIFTYTNFSAQSVFKDCIFNKYTDFQDVDFDNVSFYNSTFKDDVRFCGFSFNKANFSYVQFNKIIDFSMTTMDKNKMSFVGCKTTFTLANIQKLSEKQIVNLKDSYCTIKSILTTQHNILEAANWRKLELYAKEVELEYKKPKSFTREWIDKWQLTLYRYMCDHHTDTLKIVEYTLMCIATFVLYLFIVRYGLDFQSFVDDYKLEIDGVFVTNSKSLILIYMSILLCFVWCQATRFIVSFAIFLGLAFFEPKYIFGVVNFINDEYLTRCESIGLQSIGIVLYSIIFMILIFSLQKTLRKSSIIPT